MPARSACRRRRRRRVAAVSAACAALLALPGGAAALTQVGPTIGFDSGSQGFNQLELFSDCRSALLPPTLTGGWDSTGGNPGGSAYVRVASTVGIGDCVSRNSQFVPVGQVVPPPADRPRIIVTFDYRSRLTGVARLSVQPWILVTQYDVNGNNLGRTAIQQPFHDGTVGWTEGFGGVTLASNAYAVTYAFQQSSNPTVSVLSSLTMWIDNVRTYVN